MSRRRVALSTLAFVVILAQRGDGDKVVRLDVSPRRSLAVRQTLTLRVHVEVEDVDRWISVQADTDTFSRTSTQPCRRDQRTYPFEWRDVPAGIYDIVAGIGAGPRVRATDRVRIQIGAEGDSP